MAIISSSILDGTTSLFELDRDYIVLPDVVLATSNPLFGVSVFATTSGSVGTTLTVLGTIASSFAPVFVGHGQNHSIAISTNGTVAVEGTGGAPAIYLGVQGCRVDNAGQIIGGVTGIQSIAAGTVVVNSGQITGAAGGIALSGSDSSITNTGLIAGSRGDNQAGFIGVTLSGGTNLFLFNDGTILGNGGPSSSAISVGGGAAAKVTNTGLMASSRGDGILVDADATVILTNTGTISGNRSFVGGAEGDTVVNRGTMIGDVLFGIGDDVFDGIGGTVVGQVLGGIGDDVFRLSDATLALVEAVSGGRDRVESTVDFNLQDHANIENLTLLAGAVTGVGNAAANVLFGNLADNRLDGLAGNDRIESGAGDDLLRGGLGRDLLLGGVGNDRIVGGRDRDKLTGGEDADTFVFSTLAASGTTNRTRDVITDFASGEDSIDLSDIDADNSVGGDQTFTWIGTAGFTAGTAGQVRFSAATGDLQADVTGDGVADFSVRLNGISMLSAGDLVL